jgi:hypothetical protein
LVKWWPASSRRLWLPCLNTGWRDWNRCLRTMVITIHKSPVGSFTFLQCLSGTELLRLSGTPYVCFTKFSIYSDFDYFLSLHISFLNFVSLVFYFSVLLHFHFSHV